MVDQSLRFPEGVIKDVMVRIQTSDQGISTSTYLPERYAVNLEHKLTMSRSGSNATGEDAKPTVSLPSLTMDGKTFLARL